MNLRSRNYYNQDVQNHVTTMADVDTRTPNYMATSFERSSDISNLHQITKIFRWKPRMIKITLSSLLQLTTAPTNYNHLWIHESIKYLMYGHGALCVGCLAGNPLVPTQLNDVSEHEAYPQR